MIDAQSRVFEAEFKIDMSTTMHDGRVNMLDQLLLADPTLDPGAFERLYETQRQLGLLHGDRPTCPFLRPHILSRLQYEAIKQSAEILAVAFEKIADEALTNQELMDLLRLTPMEETMARLDPGYSTLCVTSRLDSYVTSAGFSFLEYNAENPAGVGDQMQLEKVLFTLPTLTTFLTNQSHWLQPLFLIPLSIRFPTSQKSANGF